MDEKGAAGHGLRFAPGSSGLSVLIAGNIHRLFDAPPSGGPRNMGAGAVIYNHHPLGSADTATPQPQK